MNSSLQVVQDKKTLEKNLDLLFRFEIDFFLRTAEKQFFLFSTNDSEAKWLLRRILTRKTRLIPTNGYPGASPGPTRGQPRPDVRLIAGDRWNRSFPEWNKSAIFELNLFLNATPVVGFFSRKSKVAGSLFGFF